MATETKRTRGFTIIEVVLVLAIAGLIFLVVLLAVPALQRSQRDTQRRNDAGRFMSQLQQYQSNNRGAVPAGTAAAMTAFTTNYLTVNGDVWADPTTGATYTIQFAVNPANVGQIYYATGANGFSCNGTETPTALAAGGSSRKVAIQVKLEGNGYYCVNN